MIAGKYESKTVTKHHANVDVSLTLKNATQINSGTTINVGGSVRIRNNIV